MQTVEQLARAIVAREGGFVNDPDDPGGATNFGVTIHTMRRLGLDLDRDGGPGARSGHRTPRSRLRPPAAGICPPRRRKPTGLAAIVRRQVTSHRAGSAPRARLSGWSSDPAIGA